MAPFLNLPFGLFIAALVVGLALFLRKRAAEREEKVKLFQGSFAEGAPVGRPAKVVPLVVLGALALALARPYWGSDTVTVPGVGRDIMIVFDISRSMLTKDVVPSRLELAKRKAFDFIDGVAASGGSDRIGITLFAGAAYVYSPLTSDLGTVKLFLQSLSTQLITEGGSTVGGGLRKALEALDRAKSKGETILLLTDGEDENPELEKAKELLSGRAVRVHVLGFGTPEGRPIELGEGIFQRDLAGQIVVSRLNEAPLEELAERTGGTYARAAPAPGDVRGILAALPKEGESRSGKTTLVYNELGPFLLWVALGSLLVGIGARMRSALFLLPAALLLLAGDVGAESLRDGYSAYQEGNYERAREIFERRRSESPEDPAVTQALASAYYKLGRFEEAEKLFASLAERSKEGKPLFENRYNSGNALVRGKRYKEGIEAYEKALEVKPDDEKAKHNLEVARRLLMEENRKKEEKKNDGDRKKDREESEGEKDDGAPRDEEKRDDTSEPGKNEPGKSGDKAPNERREEEKGEEKSEEKGDEKQDASPAGTPSPTPRTGGGNDEKKEAAKEPSPEENEEKERDEELPSSREEREAQESKEGGAGLRAHDPRSLEEREAKAWLDSLPEAPLLLRQERGRSTRKKQTW